jgi:HEAT repeat protein
LGKDQLIALTPDEVNGFLNPQAALDAAVASVTELAVDLRITNADRKKDGPRSARRGNFGADFVEDEDWAERVKADKLKKAQQQKMGGEGDDVVSKKRAELDELNGYIGKIVYRARRLLQALGFMIEQCGKHADTKLQPLLLETNVSILSSVTHLLPCPLVEKDAVSTLLQLCNSSIDSLMVPLVRDMVDTIRLIAIHVSPSQEELVVGTFGTAAGGKKAAKDRENLQKRLKKMVEHSGPPSRLLKGLAAFVGRAGQARYVPSPYTVQLLFPIFRGLLQLPALVTGCELTFTLFDCVWPSTEDLPIELTRLCKPALELCLVVMSQLRVEPSPETTILRIVGQISRLLQQKKGVLAESALEPLLGDLGMCSAATNVRLACVRALSFVARSSTTSLSNTLSCRLYQAKYDSEDAVKDLATTMLGELVSAGCAPSLPAQFIEVYLPLFNHETAGVRDAASRALATGLQVHSDLAAKVVAELQSIYKGALPIPPSIKTKDKGLDFGLPPKKSLPVADKIASSTPVAVDDKFSTLRCAVATAVATLGSEKSLSQQGNNSDLILQVLDFLLANGVVDPSDEVRNAMVTAGRSFVDGYAATLSSSILSVLNTVLKRQPVKGEDLVAYDHRHEAAVVFLGVTGRHLDKEDPHVVGIVETLVDALKIPAESVQRAVAECLSPLVQAIKTSDRVNEIFSRLMTQVTDAATYGERRGSAFGISAFVKGMGITSLKQHDVINRLREACENGTVNARQGGFGAFECLSERLGMLFEPYITTIVPILLKSFSHASDHVREAAQLAAKVIMGRLSAHGVKVVLTPILTSLPTETAWKTRQEAIRLLGTMVHCAPKQLASCLPQIIPRLVEASYDPHPKVKEAAKNAMSDISSVIKNPEVSRLSPVLLAALSDPANKTKEALEALLECEFMHSIDAPSLALLVPILGRALKDRGADLKRKSAAITGNMMTMVSDPKFLVPYLAAVLPGLRDCLLDPIPDVRATSAKALGCLIAGVGEEEELADLVPWLTTTLCTEASPVERSGAAQGLAEVCLALGGNRVVDVLQQTLPLHLSTKGAAREGLLWLLSFLPAVLQESFADHIATTLPVVLSGLSDSIDSVREVAMRAGQIMVSTLGKTHTLELLPSLCEGMFDGDWHIRHSSVMLLGELLYLIGDTKASGIVDGDDDDDDDGGMGSTSRVSATIRVHLGSETTHHMLASLYIVRSDTSNMVRQSALQVWKSVVSNTPRTLVEIMSELVAQMVEKLSADTSELRIVAGRALGEVVRKLGDRVLPAVVPHLRAGLEGGDLGMREGVCLGLAEILQASTRRQIEDYISVLVPALEQGLCDQSEVVRSQAAKAFQTLCKALGPRAIEDVLPSLITKVAKAKEVGEEPNLALLGLREIVAAKPRDILEYLLPKFFVSPMLESSAFVLGAVADVSGAVLQYHFGLIIPGYCRELIAASADEGAASRLAVLKESASNVMASVSTSGVNSLCHDVKAIVEHESSTKHRRWGCWFLEQFVSRSKASFLDYVPIVLKYLLSRVAETDPPLLQAVSDALAGVSSSVDMESLMSHIDFVRSCISSTASDARHSASGHLLLNLDGEVELPLFSVPKSLEPLMAIFLHGVMNGNPQVRENAADAIGEIAILTNPAALKPYLIKSTGPLIRVVGDRIPSNVKTSILQVRFVVHISSLNLSRNAYLTSHRHLSQKQPDLGNFARQGCFGSQGLCASTADHLCQGTQRPFQADAFQSYASPRQAHGH